MVQPDHHGFLRRGIYGRGTGEDGRSGEKPDELLSYNPRDTYLKSLKADIEDYKTRDKIIVQSSVSDSNDITYATVDGDYCAYVDAYYFSREASDYSRTYEEFVLRRDDEGHWKILSFRLTEGDNDE